MNIVKIGFTGNRTGLRPDQEDQIKLIFDKYDTICVSHGDCIGADTDFHNLCIKYKDINHAKTIVIHIYPPDVPTLRAFNKADVIMETKPFLKRNLDILKNSTILIACPMDKNKEELRSGTWSTIRQARKRQYMYTYIVMHI